MKEWFCGLLTHINIIRTAHLLRIIPEDMHPWDREATTRVLHPDGGGDEVALLLADLGMCDGILGGQQLPCNAPH